MCSHISRRSSTPRTTAAAGPTIGWAARAGSSRYQEPCAPWSRSAQGVLSQWNTLSGLRTLSVNDKRVFEDFRGSPWADLVTYLETPPEAVPAILVGKAAAGSIPVIIEYGSSLVEDQRSLSGL